MKIEDLGFVKASKYRQKILKELTEGKEIPSEIAKKLDTSKPQISSTLKELKERKIVECVTPERRKGRIYDLTEKGRKIVKEL
ncbi:hypothetical protein AKJ40_04435 [candidate division MSBL1 archaeon SCGC-AAA259M10]|uniref:HTH arsR-type domain-containing protein n=1 Tax=candidate division MSBL1 archaeon SCGC-AAA259M10 TaxID=1698270 RepID=A0A133UX95_9EURY|nr:hypothetical protein AKJ40_04435 [candidate division MSBL1 archaeon SCGC-AAA259M10]